MAVSAYFDATGRGTPGQLRDGSVIGIIRDSNTGDSSAFGWKIRTRYYMGKLVCELIQYSTATTAVSGQEGYSVRGRETLLASNAMVVALGTTSINKFATEAELAAMRLAPGDIIPKAPTDDEIPFELDADLHVLKKDLPLSDVEFVQQIGASNLQAALVAGASATPSTTSSTTTSVLGMNVDMSQVVKIGIVLVVLVAAYKFAQSQDWI